LWDANGDEEEDLLIQRLALEDKLIEEEELRYRNEEAIIFDISGLFDDTDNGEIGYNSGSRRGSKQYQFIKNFKY